MATSPTLLVSLDIQTPERRGALTLMQASTPVILVQILQRGQVFRPGSDWTATLKFAATLSPAGWTTVTNASVDVANGIFRFEFSAAQANATGLKHCLVHVLDADDGVFFSGRIDLTFIASNANTGAGDLPVGETVDWSGTSYANTATAGPYRAGDNVTFGANADGSVDINAALGAIADGSITTAKLASAAVTLAKMANLSANSILGNNTGSAATPIALTAAQVRTLLDLSGLFLALAGGTNGANLLGTRTWNSSGTVTYQPTAVSVFTLGANATLNPARLDDTALAVREITGGGAVDAEE